MRAVVFHGPGDIAIEEVPDPTIEAPHDAVIRVTTANICESDLRREDGRAGLTGRIVLGHETMGVVEAVGDGVDRIRVGDRVSVPAHLACGTCRTRDGVPSACRGEHPPGPSGGHDHPAVAAGGGQAEYQRVPWADLNLLELPPGNELESDLAMLSDVFPTGHHGTQLAGVQPGRTVAIFGAGPVGLMAAHSAVLRGAAQVLVVDKEPGRLARAEKAGATGIDASTTDPVDQIMDATVGVGVDCGVQCIGDPTDDQADPDHPELVADDLITVIRRTGRIGIVTTHARPVPAGPDDGAARSRPRLDQRALLDKDIGVASGPRPVGAYNRELRDLIIAGRATPSFIASHDLPFDDAVDAHRNVDERVDGWTKVLLHPDRRGSDRHPRSDPRRSGGPGPD